MLKLAIFCFAVLISTCTSSHEYAGGYEEHDDYVGQEYHKEPVWYSLPYSDEAYEHHDELYEPKRTIEIHRPIIDLIKPDGLLLRKSLSKIHRKISNLKSGLMAILASDLKKLHKTTDIQRRDRPADRYHDNYDEYRPIQLEYEEDWYH